MTELNSTNFHLQKEWQGLCSFPESMEIQNQRASVLRGTKSICLLGLEYEKVITAGHRIKEDELTTLQNLVTDMGYQVFSTTRGGMLTLHGRGQLVIYPLMDIREWKLGPKAFIKLCLQTTVQFLSTHGLKAAADEERSGVYDDRGRKFAFCGLKVDRGVVTHGISININNDLSEFKLIVPCGEPNLSMVSLSSRKELSSLFAEWSEIFDQNLSKLIK